MYCYLLHFVASVTNLFVMTELDITKTATFSPFSPQKEAYQKMVTFILKNQAYVIE